MDTYPEVYRRFAFELGEEFGCQLGAKIMQDDIQMWGLFGNDEKHLPHRAVERKSMFHVLPRGHLSILLRAATKLSTTQSAILIDSFRHFPADALKVMPSDSLPK